MQLGHPVSTDKVECPKKYETWTLSANKQIYTLPLTVMIVYNPLPFHEKRNFKLYLVGQLNANKNAFEPEEEVFYLFPLKYDIASPLIMR